MLKDVKSKLFEKLLNLPRELEVQVGILADDAAEKHPGGETIVDLAEKHEFGIGVPKRSFLRDGIDENEELLSETSNRLLGTVLDGAEVSTVGEQLALFSQGLLQKRFLDGIGQELAGSTKERKGFDTQLVETGKLRSSITSKAVVK